MAVTLELLDDVRLRGPTAQLTDEPGPFRLCRSFPKVRVVVPSGLVR
ncbi:MAG: hypothetical protein L0241_21070 [Planctomycetia bacterium]|nr:hypothetical protein [Planctomycetia bacterium]